MKLASWHTVALALIMTVSGPPSHAQNTDDAAIRRLLDRLEKAVQSGDGGAYSDLLSPTASTVRAANFTTLEFRPGATRVVIQERDRQALRGTLIGNGYRLIVDAFIEFGASARIATWQLDVRKIDASEWLVGDQERVSGVDRLYRLAINSERQFDARDFRIRAEDLDLTLAEGTVFTIDTEQGVTGLILVGRGEMRFAPTPDTEKGQVRIFAGTDTLESRFDAAYIRLGSLDSHANRSQLVSRPVDPRDLRKAEQIFREESIKSFTVDLGDLSRDTWSLLPGGDDLLAEVHTRRYDTLTYARSSSEAEDISVFDRRRQRNISAYASAAKLAARGRFYNEDELADYDVLGYDIDLDVSPDRNWLEGRVELRLKTRSPVLNQITLRLANSLVVHSVVSEQFGRLFSLRAQNQNAVLVNLPAAVLSDTELTLTVTYGGRLAPQAPDRETLELQLGGDQRQGLMEESPFPRAEPSQLYSSRSYWYPQSTVSDYATSTLQISVPTAFGCVATGDPLPGSPTIVTTAGSPPRRMYRFAAIRPIRYQAFLLSRFARAGEVTVEFASAGQAPSSRALASAGRGQPSPLPASAGQAGNGALTEEILAGRGPAAPSPVHAAAGRGAPLPLPASTGQEGIRGPVYDTLDLTVYANPQQLDRGRGMTERAADIARFYQSVIGDSPYGSFTLALIENTLPGGHSPGYFAALNQPLPNSTLAWRTDPANFEGFPEFFLAHEMAHQWWGQAVGWQNYHEQWLSEGFAQYFAGLYAKQHRGDQVFTSVLRQWRKWSLDRSDQGPVYLGYRLGHIRNDGRVFRALVYNKGAAVLHMLRRLVGDEAFFRGIRRFYAESRFRKAGTEDLRRAMEAESDRPLDRFFERWIYGSTLPRLTFAYRVERQEVVLHFEQPGEVFDVPVTVTLQYADRRPVDILVPITDRIVDQRVALEGTLRSVEISKDDGSLVVMDRNR
jgi:hypothetical protein